jgi:protease I
MKRALIITWTYYQDSELIYAYYRLLEEGFSVDIFSDQFEGDKVSGVNGTSICSNGCINELDYSIYGFRYDFLVLVGGVRSIEYLRCRRNVLDFIRIWNQEGKMIASICHSASLLISAGIVKGKRICGYYSIRDDINNAGGVYSDAPFEIDGNICSSPHYKYLGPWMKNSLALYNKINAKTT